MSSMAQRTNMKWKVGFLVPFVAVFIFLSLLKPHSLFKWDKVVEFMGSTVKIQRNVTSVHSAPMRKTFRVAWYQQDPEIQMSLSKYDPQKCNITNCLIEQNSSLADIVVLRHSFLPYHPVIQKRRGQLWVLYSSESPHHTHYPPEEWADQIDMSASYMESADFFVPLYGRVELRKTGLQRNYTGILTNKTRDAVWVSSHCITPSGRENLVRALSEHLKVDKFGTCGDQKCGKQYDDFKKCENTFVNNYKFYFSFENSICDNYTTEKLYFLFRDSAAIIPVVNGPRDVDKYLPINTYINSLDFASPKMLAEKLKEIGNNETIYTSFLTEKEKYTMPGQSVNDLIDLAIHKFQCDMCRYLHDLDIGKSLKKPKTWQRIFNPSVQCKPDN
ncbi:glycoprotein 3-alpha-L-fucosyltransferase A-like isoform X3 [Crassostrea virginica]